MNINIPANVMLHYNFKKQAMKTSIERYYNYY